MKLLLLSFAFLLSSTFALFHHKNAVNVLLKEYEGANDLLTALPPPEWFDQKLDHFNPFTTVLWKQRYFVNSDYHRPGGPVFIHIGGEGAISARYVYNMSFMPLAQKYGALVLALEHRYYGESRPTIDMSTPNLQWLSSQQALADLANFRDAMMKKYQLQRETRWVTIGGSYPGCLSAWARIKYPHLFYAASAVSAPVRAKLNFYEYNEVVANALGAECTSVLKDATRKMDALLDTPEGRATLTQKVPTCTPMLSYEDTQVFFDSVTELINGVVQYNAARAGAITITDMCAVLTEPGKDSLERLYALLTRLMAAEQQTCLEANIANTIAQLSSTKWEVGGAMRAWVAQTCAEFGFYQTSDSASNPYSTRRLDIQFSLSQCVAAYGKYPMPPPIDWTNTYYGSDHPDEERIVWSNGSIDPWHALGVTHDLSPTNPAVFIQGTSHCADMATPKPTDPPALTEGRQKVLDTVDKWLSL